MPQQSNPSVPTLRRAKVLWEQSGADFREAKATRRRNEHLQSSFLSLQAAVNALSAVCQLNGHFQVPTGSPVHLMALCAEADPHFADLPGSCPGLDEAMEGNPFAADRDPVREAELSRRCLEEGGAILKLTKSYLKHNRRRFFAP